MGTDASHASFRNATQNGVFKACRDILRDKRFFVSPALNGWVTVFASEFDREGEESIANSASPACRRLSCPCLVISLDDGDTLGLCLLNNEGETYAHFRTPGEQEVETTEAFAQCLHDFLQRTVDANEIVRILEDDDAERTLESLADLIGLENVLFDYSHLKFDADVIDLVVGWSDFKCHE